MWVVSLCSLVLAPGFPNVAQTPGTLLNGPIEAIQGRTAIIAWHDDRIVSIPEPPGSQPGADLRVRIVDIGDPENPSVTVVPITVFGFNAHGYFQYGPYLFVGPHCLDSGYQVCNGTGDIWADSFMIDVPGAGIGGSSMVRRDMEQDGGLPVSTYDRSGAQSPWGGLMYWSYGDIEGDAYLVHRRDTDDWVHDWSNDGAATGPGVEATWDHLGQTGVIGMPFIMGNILIYAADQSGTGVATYDISDPANPVLLDVLHDENPGGYWPEIYGHYVFFPRRDGEGGTGSNAGFQVVDFSDPTDLRVVADRNLEGSNQYVTFQDEFAFMNNYKIDMRTFEVVLTLATNDTTLDASQFALPVGNLVITGGYGSLGPGLAIWAHQAAPDTRSPYVLYHVPRPDQTSYPIGSPITLSIPETLRTETIVDGVSLIVRPVGGAPVATWHAFSEGKLLTVTPQEELSPNTTYEVELTSDILDAAGNGLEAYTFRFSTGTGLSGGNHPPVVSSLELPARIDPGTSVTMVAFATDPDGDPLEYRFDFGDGSAQTAWQTTDSTSHTFADAGHLRVNVQVRDSFGSVSTWSQGLTVLVPPAPPFALSSSSVVFTPSGLGAVANADDGSVSLSSSGGSGVSRSREVQVCADPRRVVLVGGDAWVTCHDDDSLAVLDTSTGAVEPVALGYGCAPEGLVGSPDGGALYVACQGDGTLRRFSASARMETERLDLGPSPRAIALSADGGRALVTRLISAADAGEVYDVDTGGAAGGGMTLTRTIALRRDHSQDGSASGRGVPNYLSAIAISPDGQYAFVAGKKDNTNRGVLFSPLQPLGQDSTVRAMVMVIDLQQNAEDRALRIDIDNSDSPSALAFSPWGDYLFVALQGNAQVAVLDLLDWFRQDSPGTVRARFGTGVGPHGLAFDGSGARLVVHDFLEQQLTVLDLADFLGAGSLDVPATVVSLVDTPGLPDLVHRGKQIFYDASDRRMSAEGYISCATCHLDGAQDGRTFDFTQRGEGLRNTVDLRGRSGIHHGAVHWTGNFDEIQDFENDIRGAFGGLGFLADDDFAATLESLGPSKAGLSTDLDALAAYVSSLGPSTVPRSPYREDDGVLSAAAQRGATLFVNEGCGTCHDPAHDFTDRQRHDVGTTRGSSGQRLGATLDGIDTPTLLGVFDTAPYFHDGSAATLTEVFASAGGLWLQAEDGTLTGSAVGEDIAWLADKDWHGSELVSMSDAGAVTFAGLEAGGGGPGYVEVRYTCHYGTCNMVWALNGGADVLATVAMTPNEPSYVPNEFRTVRLPMTFAAGSNSLRIGRNGSGGQLVVDDVTVVTPVHLAAASAHVRGLSPTDLADLVAYVASLDGSDAERGVLDVYRETPIANGDTDVVGVGVWTYNLDNSGGAPIHLGRLRLIGPAACATVAAAPQASVEVDASTSFSIDTSAATEPCVVDVRMTTDAAGRAELSFSIEVDLETVAGEGDAAVSALGCGCGQGRADVLVALALVGLGSLRRRRRSVGELSGR